MWLRSLIAVADKLGFESRALKVELEALPHVHLPAIIHWEMSHFVVLTDIKKGFYTINDPAFGKRRIDAEEFSKNYTGVLLEIKPSASFEQKDERSKLKINDLWDKISGLKLGFLQLLLLSFFLQFVILINPLFMQLIVDEVLQRSNFELLTVLAFGFGALAISNAVTELTRSLVVVHLSSSINYQIGANLFHHLIYLPLSYFDSRLLGDVISRFDSVTTIEKLLTEGVISTFIDGLMAITTILLMYFYSPKLAAITTAAWVFLFTFRFLTFSKLKMLEETAIISKAKQITFLVESISAIVTLKLGGTENDRHRLWKNFSSETIAASANTRKNQHWFDSITTAVSGLEIVIVTYLGALMILDTEFTVGMLVAYLAYRMSFVNRTGRLIEQLVEFRMLDLHLERVADIVQSTPEAHLLDTFPKPDKELVGRIELKNVSYRYSNDSPNVVNRLSISIEPKESVAIVGPTGCGKTTVLKLMSSLFPVTEGELYVDGMSIDEIGLSNYRKSIAVIMQDEGLINGTIIDNVTSFTGDVDELELHSACSIACILDEILAMPMQFDTRVGDMGNTLSGGQKQRIAIARAIYRKPKILFMDEATSHLDVKTEKTISDGIARLGITRVMIAHRPETINSAERVLSFRDGQLF